MSEFDTLKHKTVMNGDSQDELAPNPAAIVESLRSIGYTMETAVADIIDNSITAGATVVDIKCDLNGSESKFYIFDNGSGMDEATLHEAMRLGGKGPKERRDDNDLGRFGLGLKTASFSQCRKLVVISKTEKGIAQRSWDIDTIKERGWKIDTTVDKALAEKLSSYQTGTLVMWDKIDILIQTTGEKAEKLLANKIAVLRDHLSLTFHRFLEDGRLTIRTGGAPVFPWDPFLPSVPDVQKILWPRECIRTGIYIESVVLPHRSYFSDAEYKKAGHTAGWSPMQGFYIYRNDRLLTVAGWMGLRENGRIMRQDHFYDLARIRIDLTNEQDFEWDIDVKKSKASPPDVLIDTLTAIAINVRKEAYEVYRNRNVVNVVRQQRGKADPLWVVETSAEKLHLSLNTEFPVIKDLMTTLTTSQQVQKLQKLLKLIAETVPADKISFELSGEDSRRMSDPYEEEAFDDFTEDLIRCYVQSGYSREEAIDQVKTLLNKQ